MTLPQAGNPLESYIKVSGLHFKSRFEDCFWHFITQNHKTNKIKSKVIKMSQREYETTAWF